MVGEAHITYSSAPENSNEGSHLNSLRDTGMGGDSHARRHREVEFFQAREDRSIPTGLDQA
jgi:hypothetical protein